MLVRIYYLNKYYKQQLLKNQRLGIYSYDKSFELIEIEIVNLIIFIKKLKFHKTRILYYK